MCVPDFFFFFFLQPFVLQVCSYTRDLMHLMDKLNQWVFPDRTLLVSLDIKSLYTNTDPEVGVRAITYILDKQQDSNWMHYSILVDLLAFVLKHNYLAFDRQFYKQTSGIVMGALCTLSYENLFLRWWEETHVYQKLSF